MTIITEDSLAEAFAQWHCGGSEKIGYSGRQKQWLIWDDKCQRWTPDETRTVSRFVRQFCRRVANQVSSPNEARYVASARMRAAVIDLAKDDPILAADENAMS